MDSKWKIAFKNNKKSASDFLPYLLQKREAPLPYGTPRGHLSALTRVNPQEDLVDTSGISVVLTSPAAASQLRVVISFELRSAHMVDPNSRVLYLCRMLHLLCDPSERGESVTLFPSDSMFRPNGAYADGRRAESADDLMSPPALGLPLYRRVPCRPSDGTTGPSDVGRRASPRLICLAAWPGAEVACSVFRCVGTPLPKEVVVLPPVFVRVPVRIAREGEVVVIEGTEPALSVCMIPARV